MTARVYVNNYTSTLFAAITNVATTCIVNSATGLPTLAGTDYYYLTLDNLLGVEEVVKVTARAGTTLTIVRAQEGTTGVAWAADSVIEMRATKTSFVSEPGTTGNTCVSDGTSWASVPSGTTKGYTTTATAAGTTTLTVSSNYLQFFTGATTQNCDLPVTSTLTLGHTFEIVNNSTGVVTVRSSGANTVIAIPADCRVVVNCILTTGTTAASWDYYLVANSAATTGTGDIVRATSPSLTTPALGAASATSLIFSSTSGIIGTATNDNAAAGSVGESSTAQLGSGSAVSLTTVTVADVISISLTAGDWIVGCSASFVTAATTSIGDIRFGLSNVSATLPSTNSLLYPYAIHQFNAFVPGITTFQLGGGYFGRISVPSTTTIYLVARGTFTVSTLNVYGQIMARRPR